MQLKDIDLSLITNSLKRFPDDAELISIKFLRSNAVELTIEVNGAIKEYVYEQESYLKG